MNIIFLTAATGGGHEKAAIALMQYMEKQISGCKTILIDTLKFINPLIDRLVTGTYLSTIRKIPSIYGKLYDFSEREEFITLLVKGVNGIFSHKLYNIRAIPSRCCCMHPYHTASNAFEPKEKRTGVHSCGWSRYGLLKPFFLEA